MEKLEKKLKHTTQELDLRKSYIGKTCGEELREKLEVLQRYLIAGSRQLNCPLLNTNVAMLESYCKSKWITSAYKVTNVRSVLSNLAKKQVSYKISHLRLVVLQMGLCFLTELPRTMHEFQNYTVYGK